MEMPVVLVVEGEALIRMGAILMVQDAGFEAVAVCNADEAITIMEAQSGIGAVFTGIRMSGSMNGLALARVIHDRWPPIHLIVASGPDVPANRELPANGRFIRKPYTGEQLSVVLLELFSLNLESELLAAQAYNCATIN